MSENPIKRAIDADLSGLRTSAAQREQIVRYAMEGQKAVRYPSKMRVGLVLALVLILTTVTAVAVGLSNYFDSFMGLEEEYGEYDQWPSSAKVQLVETMLESGVLTAEDTPQWTENLSAEDKEAAAEDILSAYFDGLLYIDTYNIMTRELGPIGQWTDEQRAMYTDLLEKHGMLTASYPVFQMPGTGDFTRDQAVARAKEVVLSMFEIDEAFLDARPIEASFASGPNSDGLPEDEPYWTVGFSNDYFVVTLSRDGQPLVLSCPMGTILWGEDALAESILIEPSENDATREEAISVAHDALTEIGTLNLAAQEADALTPIAQFLWNDRFCFGYEPVWLITWLSDGQPLYQSLLTYDAHYLDAVHYGKLFRHVTRDDPHLDEIVAEMLNVDFRTLSKLRQASFAEQAAFYERVKPIADAYAAEHPYFAASEQATVMSAWLYTRNVLGVPDDRAIDPNQALAIGLDAFEAQFGYRVDANDWLGVYDTGTFYIVTDPEHPQWRFTHIKFFIAIDAYSGEVLEVRENNWRYYTESFIGEIIV